MKFQVCGWSCDLCGEESPSESNWTLARKLARKEGWFLGSRTNPDHLCPPCRKAVHV